MRRILVPTDFSQSANKALELAVAIAENDNSEIDLFHFIEALDHPDFTTAGENISNPMDHVFMIKLIESVKIRLEKLVKKYNSRVTIVTRIEVSNISKSLLRLLEEEEYNLVVMGTRGNSDWDNLVLGSNTHKMIRLSSVPILVVPEEAKIESFRNLVIATNSEEEAPVFFSMVKHIQKMFFSHLHVLRSITMADFYTDRQVKKELQKFSDTNELENYSIHHYNADTVEEGVINYANDVKADLIAVISHKRTVFGNLFGSISSDIVSHSNIPVLTLNVERKNYNYDPN